MPRETGQLVDITSGRSVEWLWLRIAGGVRSSNISLDLHEAFHLAMQIC